MNEYTKEYIIQVTTTNEDSGYNIGDEIIYNSNPYVVTKIEPGLSWSITYSPPEHYRYFTIVLQRVRLIEAS